MREKKGYFQIRYNNQSTTNKDRWRLIENGKETLVSDVVIDKHTYTTKDWVPELSDYKWHISCLGYCKIEDEIAYIKTTKEESAIKRHLFKTISYRILGTCLTVSIAYSMGASLELSSLLGISELLIKPVFYFLHERFWYKFIRVNEN